jgi:hypothetical protein
MLRDGLSAYLAKKEINGINSRCPGLSFSALFHSRTHICDLHCNENPSHVFPEK